MEADTYHDHHRNPALAPEDSEEEEYQNPLSMQAPVYFHRSVPALVPVQPIRPVTANSSAARSPCETGYLTETAHFQLMNRPLTSHSAAGLEQGSARDSPKKRPGFHPSVVRV